MNMAALAMQKGVRFHPTDVELIVYFLHNKADADQAGFYSKLIYECNDFWEKEPWVIWDMYGGSTYEEGEPIYFYTKRIQKNSKSKRFVRRVCSGTWSGEYVDVVVSPHDGKTKIGTRRNFRYETGCDASQNGAWLMHEYESAFDIENNYVICGLRRNPRNQADQGDAEITKKNSAKTRKRKMARSDNVVDHQTRRQKKSKGEEIYEIVEDHEPLNMEKGEKKEETTYDEEQGSSSCTQLPQEQPYYPDQDNNTCHWINYDDGICLDDLIGPIPESPLYNSSQFKDQLYHGDDSKFKYVDYTNVGMSQLPENQLYHGDDSKFTYMDYTNGWMSQLPVNQLYHGDDSKFNVMDYMNVGMPQLPNDQAVVDHS